MAEDGRSGTAISNLIVGKIKNHNTHQNTTTNMPFLLSPDILHSHKLGQDDVPTCSLKDQQNIQREKERTRKGLRQQF